MAVAQMSINFHRQSAAVLVAKPAADGRYINARFNPDSEIETKRAGKFLVAHASGV